MELLQQMYMVEVDYKQLYPTIEYNTLYCASVKRKVVDWINELYNMWYDGNRCDPIFVLMCFKYDQLCEGIRYAMEDWLHDNK